MKSNTYTYALLVNNTPSMHLHQLTTIVPAQFKQTEYALIIRLCEPRKPEKDAIIIYSNDYAALEVVMKEHVSWYDRVKGDYKDMQGYIRVLA